MTIGVLQRVYMCCSYAAALHDNWVVFFLLAGGFFIANTCLSLIFLSINVVQWRSTVLFINLTLKGNGAPPTVLFLSNTSLDSRLLNLCETT